MDHTALAPAGIRLVADEGLRRSESGRVLIGGAPLRILRLSERGAAVVEAWLDGTPVADVKSARLLARRLLDGGLLHPVVDAGAARDITLVVPAHDDAALLDRCLASRGDTPVVVVDDGSADPARVAKVAATHGADLVRRESAGGPGVARTAGLRRVATSLVAFVDTDVELWDGWLDHLVGHFVDPAVVAVAPRVRSRPGPSLRERYERVHSPLDLGGARATVGPRRPVAYVPTAAFVARTEALRAVGGFDPGLRVGEDVDLVWRLVGAGGVVRYEPDVEVIHEPRSTWLGLFAQRRTYGTSAAKLAVRHGTDVAPARCSRWSLVAWGAVAAGRPGTAAAVAGGSSAALVPKLDGLAHPVIEAARLAGWGHLHAGLGLARALTRVWWPLALGVAARRPGARRVLAAAAIGPALRDWMRGARPSGPIRSVGLRVVDDVVYGAGVWMGVVAERDIVALLPDLAEWPGRRAAVEPDTVARR